ncbi:uncharacterized protein LOC110853160 [Folsomia candida]|uniref:uncharacterized protein LOC110853160 n=1 Tax=Folsomia candida TaxID=158441 RepID=UPI000B8F25FD|nr:uncharacterized protein LOC110853160 [Folsomia candida]
MRGLCFILVNLFVVVSLFSSPSSSAPTASIPSLTPLKQRSPPSSYNIFEGADPALNSVYGDSPKRESDPYPPPPREKVVTQEDQVAERRPGAWTPPPSAEEELLPLPLPPSHRNYLLRGEGISIPIQPHFWTRSPPSFGRSAKDTSQILYSLLSLLKILNKWRLDLFIAFISLTFIRSL